jgi:hypothetical protein
MINFITEIDTVQAASRQIEKVPFWMPAVSPLPVPQTVAETAAWLARTSNPNNLFYVPILKFSNAITLQYYSSWRIEFR